MMNQNHSSGVLFGVGVGPGDPELLTVKALDVYKRQEQDTPRRKAQAVPFRSGGG